MKIVCKSLIKLSLSIGLGLLFLLLLLTNLVLAQTTLSPGDIAIIGFNFDNPDELAFVLLRDIEVGTEIKFTDNGWQSANTFRSGEGTFTWTAPTDLLAGVVVTPSLSSVSFSTVGDQILAYQGADSNPSFIYALNSEASDWQANATSTNTSALPQGLTDGATAVALNEINNAIYGGITSGTKAQLLAAISNPANWSGSSSTRQTMPSGPFTVLGDGISGLSLTKTVTPTSNVDYHGLVSYTILLSSTNAFSDANALLTDTLPNEVDFARWIISPTNTIQVGQAITWTGTITTNDLITFTFVATHNGSYGETIINTAHYSGAIVTNSDDAAFEILSTTQLCGNPATKTHTIQSNGLTSPLSGTTDVIIEGVVVGDFQEADELKGFFVQEEDADADADPATSEGIFVYDNDFGVEVGVGDVVRVGGDVAEYFGLTELRSIDFLKICSSGAGVTTATITLPLAGVNDYEPYEGMLVQFPQQLAVTELYDLGHYGQLTLAQGGRLQQPTNIITPGAAANTLAAANVLRRIVLDDSSTASNPNPIIHPAPGLSPANILRGGDVVSNLSGVLDYSFGQYRVQPTGPVTFSLANPRPASPPAVGGRLKVASFNVLNYFTTLDDGSNGARGADSAAEFTRQRNKIITAVVAIEADIIGLMELENNATAAIQDLVNGLNTATGAGTYDFIDAGPMGSDKIKVGLIYKPGVVTPLGSPAILTSAVNPLFNDAKNRPALAQTFEEKASGEKLTVVVNHLKSKGSPCDDVGDSDAGDGQGNCNLTRTKAMTAESAWLATDPTGSGDPDFLIIGDLNAYAREDPISVAKNAGYTNLLEKFGGAEAYTYVYKGQWGYLDHALSSPGLTWQVVKATVWHINAGEARALDYNDDINDSSTTDDILNLPGLYSPEAYRASDHDPVIVGLNLRRKIYLPLIQKN